MNFNTPFWEGVKEVSRWAFFFVVSWIVTETLKQLSVVPEFATVQIWVFSYEVPVRMTLQVLLTSLGRFSDKFIFTSSKQERGESKGLLPW